LLEATLNLGDPVVYDTVTDAAGAEKRVVNQKDTIAAREKQEAMAQEFRSWVWEQPERATRLARIYNDTMNTMRLWEPDGAHLSLPGANPAITFRPHQKNFIWRGLQQPNALAHHVVGAGKTFAGIALALEKRRLGLARKPMVVVPNHLVQQWARDILRLYPAARVLASTKKDFEPANRKRFLNRIATGDWDLVVVPMSHFGMIEVSAETFNDHVRRELASYEEELRRAREDAGKNDPSVKELEKAKLNLEAKLRTTKERQKKDADIVTFEQLGVDMLMVDEAHNYKKLGFPTKMTRVAGVPAGPGSQRAFDLVVKSGYLAKANPTGGTVFLTGTPISNTMAEMFVLMRYLAQGALNERGIPQFDGWAATFGEKVTAFEISPTGRGFRQKTRFSRFTNLPELVQMYRAFADVQTADMLKLPTPPLKGGKAQVHTVAATPELDAYVEELLERFAAVLGQSKTGRPKPDPTVDNPLKITTDGRKAALDLRLVGLEQPEGGKVEQVANKIHEIWKRTAKPKGTQLVFADLGTPSERAKAIDIGDFTVYDALRDRLADLGIPREQIRFIQEANTDVRKQALFDAMNAGDVRVLIGSSETMGAGMNVQKRLVALHHMDAPWRPSDIEQREGRILRQGNDFLDPESAIYDPTFEVEIHTYVTERSFDAYLWQLLENKARFIRQALKGDLTSRETDDADDVVLNFAQAKGAASGNPAIMEHAKTQSDVQRLEASEANHDRRKWRLQRELASLPEQIAGAEQLLANAEALVAAVRMPADRKDFAIEIGGKLLHGTEAAEAIVEKFERSRTGKRRQLDSHHYTTEPVTIGHAAGVEVRGYYAVSHVLQPPTVQARWVIAAGDAAMEKNAATGAGAMNSLAIFLENDPKKAVDRYTQELATLRSSLDVAKTEVAKPFAGAEKLKALRARLKELEQLLNLDAKSQAEEAAQAGVIVQTAEEEKADLAAERAAEQADDADVPTAPGDTKTAAERALGAIEKVEDAAKRRLDERGTFKGTKLTAGIPVDDVTDLVIIGAAKIAKGTVQFAQWSAEMVRDFGEAIRPHLRSIYEQARVKAAEFGPRPVRVDSGRVVPPQQAIDDDRVREFPSLQKMPQAIRRDIADLLEKYQGFEPQRRGVQTWERTRELAKDTWLPLETLRPGTALNAEELEAYKTAVATALTERQVVLDRIKDGTATDWDRLQFSHLTDVATVLTASYRGAKAEAGRALNILRAQAHVLELQESRFLDAALRAPGFQQDLTRISKASLEAAGDPLKQLQILRRRYGDWFDYVQAAYYTNLLSGIKTHLRNIIGNSFNVLANTMTPLGAAPVDAVRARRQGGARAVYLGEIPRAVVGGFIGLNQGLKNAAFTFREGFRPSTVEAAAGGTFDRPRVELPGGMLTNWPSRALEAADEFFRAIARQQELYAGAYAQARNEGLTATDAITARMADLLAATDPAGEDAKLYRELSERADRFAARSVFQEEPGWITNWLLKAKAPTTPVPVRAAATFIVPFIRTPAAILRQGFEWSPAGLVMRAAQQGGREGAQAMGRAALGTGFILGPIAWLAVTGRLTGAPPEDPGEREEFYAQGKLANAVRIGDYWVRYALFQPFSVPMAAVANAWEHFQHSDQDEAAAQEAFTAALAGAGASLLDQSFLAGLGTFIDAVNDPTRYAGQWLNLFAQGFVPYSGLLRNVTQAVDPVYRRPEGVTESVQSIIPGASSGVLPRRTRFGEEARRPGDALTRGFVVPEVSKAIDDDVTATLARLKVQPTTPRARFTLRGRPVQLTREQQDIVAEAVGRERKLAVERLLQVPAFRGLSDEAQRAQLERVIAAATDRVRPRVLQALAVRRPLSVPALVSPGVMVRMRQDQNAMFGRDANAVAR
ncbi:MAG TPA: hypothetical protein VEA16_08370, partial [Vicinamibacterales bacterium]|nr:hypothetical protein [Vicinamibacterales bacterium]